MKNNYSKDDENENVPSASENGVYEQSRELRKEEEDLTSNNKEREEQQ